MAVKASKNTPQLFLSPAIIFLMQRLLSNSTVVPPSAKDQKLCSNSSMGLQQFQEFINIAHEVINKVRSKYVQRMFLSVLLFLAWVLMFYWQHLCEGTR